MKTNFSSIVDKIQSDYCTPEFLSQHYFPSLNGWRAFAILIVIFGHLKNSVDKSSLYYHFAEFFIYPELGVRIFFVLSGFLITTLLIKEYISNEKISIKTFFIKRSLRIFPVLYLYLLVILILNFYLKLDLTYGDFLGPAFYITNILFYFAQGTWITGHTWTLSIEEQFYLIWPFVFSYLTKKTWMISILFLFIPFLHVLWYYYPATSLLTFRPFLQGADGIFIGSMLSVACFKGLIYENSKLWKSFLLPFVSALIIFWVYYCIHRGLMGVILLPFGSLISDLSICILILVSILHLDGIIYKILNTKILISIGIISYSLYIWHNLLILPRDYKVEVLPRLPVPFNVLLTFIVSYFSYYYFEKHFLKLKKNLNKAQVNK